MTVRSSKTLIVGVVAVGLFSTCAESVDIGDVACGSPCYLGPPGTKNVGVCSSGRVKCSSVAISQCAEQSLPSRESCDGLDNNCDGQVDNLEPLPCSLSCGGASRAGHYACRQQAVICLSDTATSVEQCNGLDDNCNNVIDDIDLRFCYSGALETANHPPCQPGILVCIAGREACVAEVVPALEVCTETAAVAVDEDCDGVIDNVPQKPDELVDVVVAVDVSRSMRGPILTVQYALQAFGHKYGDDTRFRFWLYTFPALPGGTWVSSPVCSPAGCTGHLFASAVGADVYITDLALEPSYDILTWLAQSIPWRPTADRVILLFTDEQGQTQAGYTELDVGIVLDVTRVKVLTFTIPQWMTDFDDLGDVFLVRSTEKELARAFERIVPACPQL